MRVLVYGAGVLGSLFAARLKGAGNDVAILARGRRLADIREHGIVLTDAITGATTVTRVEALADLRPDDAYDLVLVLVRESQVASALPSLRASQTTPNIAFLMNNAAGADELVATLGRERVILGFPGAGGTREGHVVRYVVAGERQPTMLGELDGARTARIEAIARALGEAGLPAEISPRIDAWLKTHVALISPVANGIYAAGGDNYRLARTPDGLLLVARAVVEGLRVLRALGVPITPPIYRVFSYVPEPLLVLFLRRVFDRERAELLMARHANAARDEMGQLAEEFRALARRSGLPTPAIDRLRAYVDPAVPPLPVGSARLPKDWRSVGVGLGILGAAIALVASRALRR